MPVIYLETLIKAPIKVCFDLSRSVDVHLASTQQTGETAVAGKTLGLLELNETVTWRAKHLGIWQKLTSKVTVMRRPTLFVDEMVKGAFSSMRHEHHFSQLDDHTQMIDIFSFKSPLWLLGDLVNFLFLKRYMAGLLVKRNEVIKQFAELTQIKNKETAALY